MAINVNFSGSPLSGNIPLSVNFIDQSTNLNEMNLVINPIISGYLFSSIRGYGKNYIACINNTTTSGYVYISRDHQKTWLQKKPIASSADWSCVDLNNQGDALVCRGNSNGYIYYSHWSGLFGENWVQSNSPLKQWSNVRMSWSGNFCMAISNYDTSGIVWTSSNKGIDWTKKTGISGKAIRELEISVDGKVGIMVGLGSPVYLTEDYGNTWSGCYELGVANGPDGPHCAFYGVGSGNWEAYAYLGSGEYIKKFDSITRRWRDLTEFPQVWYQSIYINPFEINQSMCLIASAISPNKIYIDYEYNHQIETFDTGSLYCSKIINGGRPLELSGAFEILACCWTSSSSSTALYNALKRYYGWEFGDGNKSSLKNPTYTYTNRGSYNVKHIIDDSSYNLLTKSGYINTNRTNIVNISGGLIKNWTYIDGSGVSPDTPNTHTITISGGLIKNWVVNSSGTRVAHNHNINISGGLVKSWGIT